MSPIPVGASPLLTKIERIKHRSTQVIGGTAVDGFGQGVRSQYGDSVGEALGDLRLEAVVPTAEIVAEKESIGAQDAGLKKNTVIDVLVGGWRTVHGRIRKARGVVGAQSLDLGTNLSCVSSFDH